MLMLESLDKLDTVLFLWLNGLHSAISDKIFWWVSGTAFWIPLYLLIISVLVWCYRRRVWVVLVMIAASITLADQFASSICKPFFARFRPSHEPDLEGFVHLVADANGELYRGGEFGFISSHAANSFALAMLLFLLLGKRWKGVKWLFVWAAVVAYSRIALGVHYPADIILGALSGMCWAWLVWKIGDILCKKYFKTNISLS